MDVWRSTNLVLRQFVVAEYCETKSDNALIEQEGVERGFGCSEVVPCDSRSSTGSSFEKPITSSR